MPLLRYIAVEAGGRRRRGTLQVESELELDRRLRDEGCVLLECRTEAHPDRDGRSARLTRSETILLARSVGALLTAGIPLARALATAETILSARAAGVCRELRTRISKGESLADGLASTDASLPAFLVEAVRAGERGGDLAGAFARITDQLERQAALRGRVVAALAYPVVLLAAGALSFCVLFLLVLPRFADVLADAGGSLRALPAALLTLSAAGRAHAPIIAGAVAATTLLIVTVSRTVRGRSALARAALAVPLAGDLRRMALGARFARLLTTLLRGGTPLVHALEHVGAGQGDPEANAAIRRVRERVRRGTSLRAALDPEATVFPALLVRLAGIGEEASDLPAFLEGAVQTLEDQLDASLNRATSVLEPALVLLFGGAIGLVALALLQAIYGVNVAALP